MADLDDGPNMDPFHPDNVGAVQTVVLMRIYDVMMAILNDIDHEAATTLHNLHAEGRVVGSFPVLDMTDDETN